jgi:hypothetical protein
MKKINPTKEWFISEYEKIHSSLNSLEKEMNDLINNEMRIIYNPEILKELKEKTKKLIDQLNKTREYERNFFKY